MTNDQFPRRFAPPTLTILPPAPVVPDLHNMLDLTPRHGFVARDEGQRR